MSNGLRALVLEDREGSLGSLRDQLRNAGYEPSFECIDSLAELSAALDRSKWDVVISNGEMTRNHALQERTLEKALFEQTRLSGLTIETALVFARAADISQGLQECVAALVKHLNAALAQIWTRNQATGKLDLAASAGPGASIDNTEIALIAERRQPCLKETFAGHPITREDRVFGVVAIYGSQPLMEVTAQGLESVSGAIASFMERKLTEESLIQDRTLLRMLIDKLPDYIYAKGRDHRFLIANSALSGRMGVANPIELLGKSDLDFYPAEIAAKYISDEEELLVSGEAVINREESCEDANGQTIWHLTSEVPFRDPAGNVAGLMGIGRNITKRRLAELEIVKAKEAAEEANREKSALLGEIERLNDQLKRENSRMSAELEVTQRLQQMMLPRDEDLSKIANLDIAGFMEPAGEVGGDYYDVISGDDGVFFGIGDVTGHGLESGVVAIMVQTAVRTLLASGHYESGRFFEVLNRVIYDNVRLMNDARNVTFNLLRYQDKFVTISGQHEEVLVVRSNGDFEKYDTLNLGFPLGLEKNISSLIGEARVPLQSGDVMIVYTDGITEAINRAGAAFGIARLCEVVRTSHGQPAAGIRAEVLGSLREYIGEQQLLDDISLLVIKPV